MAGEKELLSRAKELLLNIPLLQSWISVQCVKRCGWCRAYDEDMGPQPFIHDEDCPLAAWLEDFEKGG